MQYPAAPELWGGGVPKRDVFSTSRPLGLMIMIDEKCRCLTDVGCMLWPGHDSTMANTLYHLTLPPNFATLPPYHLTTLPCHLTLHHCHLTLHRCHLTLPPYHHFSVAAPLDSHCIHFTSDKSTLRLPPLHERCLCQLHKWCAVNCTLSADLTTPMVFDQLHKWCFSQLYPRCLFNCILCSVVHNGAYSKCTNSA